MKTYQELVVWQLADELRKEVYRLLRDGPAGDDLRFAGQLRAAVASISANIAEGFRRYGSVEFARYLEIAFASAGEAANWLDDGVARGHWVDDEVAAARQLLRRLNPALTHLMRYLRSPQARTVAANLMNHPEEPPLRTTLRTTLTNHPHEPPEPHAPYEPNYTNLTHPTNDRFRFLSQVSVSVMKAAEAPTQSMPLL